MSKLLIAILLCAPGLCFPAPGCPPWPTDMAIVHLKNAGITTPMRLDESKTKAVLPMPKDVEKSLQLRFSGCGQQAHTICRHIFPHQSML